MRRALLIFLALVLVLVGWSSALADDGFYVIPAMRGNYAPVPKTGQTTPYASRDDGALKKGVAWPIPRFTDNNNGTVTDNLTKLIWMKNANYWGPLTWEDARWSASSLQAGYAGLTDGSKPGDWRLPNLRELQSLIDYAFYYPALSNTLGTGQWTEGNPFQGVQSSTVGYYWSSSTSAFSSPADAWRVYFSNGDVSQCSKSTSNYVWCVRGGP
jgi:hypothetical protein